MKILNNPLLGSVLVSGLEPAMAAYQSLDLSEDHTSFIGTALLLGCGNGRLTLTDLAASTGAV